MDEYIKQLNQISNLDSEASQIKCKVEAISRVYGVDPETKKSRKKGVYQETKYEFSINGLRIFFIENNRDMMHYWYQLRIEDEQDDYKIVYNDVNWKVKRTFVPGEWTKRLEAAYKSAYDILNCVRNYDEDKMFNEDSVNDRIKANIPKALAFGTRIDSTRRRFALPYYGSPSLAIAIDDQLFLFAYFVQEGVRRNALYRITTIINFEDVYLLEQTTGIYEDKNYWTTINSNTNFYKEIESLFSIVYNDSYTNA